MQNLKGHEQMDLFTSRNKQTHRIKLMVARGKKGEGTVRERDGCVHTLLYSKWIATKTYCAVRGTAQCCGNLDGRSLGEKDTWIYMAESFYLH